MSLSVHKIVDFGMGLLILAMFLGGVFLIVYSGILSMNADYLERGINTSIGGGTCSGAWAFYAKWKMNRDRDFKNLSDKEVAKMTRK